MSLFDRLSAHLFKRHRVRIGPLTADHAPAVSSLHQASFARGWDQPDVARMLSDDGILSDGMFLDNSRHPSGFVMSRLAADEAEILTICLSFGQRKRGFGAMLMQQHMANLVMRGTAALFLEVDEGNEAALQLYRRFSFVKVGERSGYYPKPDGTRALALILRRNLD